MADSIPSKGVRPLPFIAGLLIASLMLAVFGVGVAVDVRPVLRCGSTNAASLEPWSAEWKRAPSATVECPSPGTGSIRLVTIRALRESTAILVLFEWPDASPDMSFEGAYYPRALTSPVSKAQESTLLRDELTVWVGEASSTGVQNSVLNGLRRNGFWIWRSQWQRDKDRNFLGVVRTKYGKPYTAYYPVHWDGAYPARFVENTNAIMGSLTSCRWIVEPARDVYTPPVARDIDGDGRWQDGRWRVMFRVPSSEFEKLGNRLAIVLSIVDGGLAERKHQRAVSQPLTLDLRIAAGSAGGPSR